MMDFQQSKLRKAALMIRPMRHKYACEILQFIADNEPVCVSRIIDYLRERHEDIEQPTVSFYIKELKDSKLISGKRSGKWVNYSTNRKEMLKLAKAIENLRNGQKKSPAIYESDKWK